MKVLSSVSNLNPNEGWLITYGMDAIGLTSSSGKQGMHVFLSSHHRRCCNQLYGIESPPCSCELHPHLQPKKERTARWENVVVQNSCENSLYLYIYIDIYMYVYMQLRYWSPNRKKIREPFQIGTKQVNLSCLGLNLNEHISCFSPLMLSQVYGPTELLLWRIDANGWGW